MVTTTRQIEELISTTRETVFEVKKDDRIIGTIRHIQRLGAWVPRGPHGSPFGTMPTQADAVEWLEAEDASINAAGDPRRI